MLMRTKITVKIHFMATFYDNVIIQKYSIHWYQMSCKGGSSHTVGSRA